MVQINPCFQALKREYIFPIIDDKLAELKRDFPHAEVVNLGVGDIALPLAPAIVKAICDATCEMGTEEGIKGYGPSCGYPFLREAIAKNEFAHLGISAEEIFISDGTNSDTVNIQELFCPSVTVGIADPTYPAYLDTCLLAGKKVISLPCLEENGFFPEPPNEHCDLVYLCSPNNPTGIAMNRSQLKKWVDYALREKAILFIDNAYETFITSPDVPRSIFEIEGAKECAVEFRSFSKTAGFTGLRCAYTILPKTVKGTINGKEQPLFSLWTKRQAIKFNGAAYPIQKGAEAVYSPQGRKETQAQVQSYLREAKRFLDTLKELGHTCYGGIDSPYIWWKTPSNKSSWDFFDLLLKQCHMITIPGCGFGKHGEGFIRLSAFSTPQKTTLALERIRRL
ncbi:MAG: LL-diaminopimelate aminotransferase [Parachlamydiales bacterium]|nr:LL-diaminopimelate aminotransferase [Verrucomicrobiota bacterium]MBX3719202.1 LL-diaminopimelate aminotransferase [Candidatus Acheromyda pituitae]